MTVPSALAILSFIVSLLTNPQAYNMTPQQAVSFSANTVSIVTQALSQPANTPLGTVPTSTVTLNIPTSTDNSQPITLTVNPPVQPVPAIGSPDLNSVVTPPVIPTCTLNVTQQEKEGPEDFTWTSTGLPTSTIGNLSYGDNVGIGGGNTEFRWINFGNKITQSNGEYVYPINIMGLAQPLFLFRLVLGSATCTYAYPYNPIQ